MHVYPSLQVLYHTEINLKSQDERINPQGGVGPRAPITSISLTKIGQEQFYFMAPMFKQDLAITNHTSSLEAQGLVGSNSRLVRRVC